MVARRRAAAARHDLGSPDIEAIGGRCPIRSSGRPSTLADLTRQTLRRFAGAESASRENPLSARPVAEASGTDRRRSRPRPTPPWPGFRAVRDDLERQVRRGDLTVKVARERAAAAAADLRDRLLKQSEGYSPTPRVFLDRLVEADKARKQAQETLSIEGLQRETNRLLRQHLVEQQLQARAGEFEGKTFVRPITGGQPAPTLDGLLALPPDGEPTRATRSALEWSRRQLEGFRNRVFDADDLRRIDLASDRPDRVNPRLVAVYIEALQGRPAEELEPFVEKAGRRAGRQRLHRRVRPGPPGPRRARSAGSARSSTACTSSPTPP